MTEPDNTIYQAFFQRSSEAMLLADLAGNILAANAAACRLFRQSAAELCRLGCAALFEQAGETIRQCIDRSAVQPAGLERIMLRGDGSHFTGRISAFQPVGSHDRNLVGMMVDDLAGHDHAASEANALALLSQSEERFRTLSESALSGIFIIEDGLLSYVNPALETIFAYAEDELLGSSPLALIHPHDQAMIAGDIARAYAGELTSVHYPVMGKRKNGEHIEIDVLATTIELNGHKAIIGNVLDITEQRRAAAALTISEQRFQLSMEATNEGVWDWNVSTGEVYYSPACYHMLGFDEADFPGNLQSWQNLLHEEDAEQAMQANMDCVEGRSEVFSVEYRLRTKDGGWLWILARGKSISRDASGRSLRLVGTNSDISERKLAEEKITASLKQLENAMQGTLLAVSNMVDMRDPYTAGHERRVAILAADIAREMGWPETQCNNMHMIGLVHDIGKISIPSEILSRPGKISALEYQIIQAHAQNGYEILKDVEFPLPIAEIIYQHHERLDGSGYPRGLSGDAILPEARILAVADVLESMSSHRPYRASLGLEKTLDEIERGKGRLFDAEVVDACLRLFRINGYTLPE